MHRQISTQRGMVTAIAGAGMIAAGPAAAQTTGEERRKRAGGVQ